MDRTTALFLFPAIALLAGASAQAAGLYGEESPAPPPKPYQVSVLPIPQEVNELSVLLRSEYGCSLKLEKGQSSIAASCPDEDFFPVVRGAVNIPIKTLTDVLFLQEAANAMHSHDDDRHKEPGFVATARINAIISAQAPDCKALDFPKNASCAVTAISQQNHLRAGTGHTQNGSYCERFYLENAPSLYPGESCGADVENGF
jgi:hypothetical protein